MSNPLRERSGIGILSTILVLSLVTAGPVAGQSHEHEAELETVASSDEELVAGVPRAFLVRPIRLNDALTPVPHGTRAASPRALAYYQQGLSYHYLYHHLNAVRSFHQALRLDPTLLPADAGLSRALAGLGSRSEAQAAVARAEETLVEVGDSADPIGRLLIELRSAALAASTDGARDAYGESLARALERYPDDIEIRMLWAMRARGGERIERLHGLLERVPDHVGAHHQLIHAYEMRHRNREAVEHGAILSALVPTVSHGRHMYGHNLMRVGRVEDAMRAFEVADSLERAYFDREAIPEHYDWHHPHNLHLLALTYWHQGRTAEAEAALRRRAGLERRTRGEDPSRLVQLGEFMVAEGRGREASKVARRILGGSDDGTARPSGLRTRAHLLEAEARLLEGDTVEARTALASTRERPSGPGGSRVARWRARVETQLLLHTGRASEASERLETVVSGLLETRGPDAWIASLLHLHALAKSAVAAGAEEVADRVIRAMLQHDPTFRPRVLADTPMPGADSTLPPDEWSLQQSGIGS